MEHDILRDYGIIVPEAPPQRIMHTNTVASSTPHGVKILRPSLRPPSPSAAWEAKDANTKRPSSAPSSARPSSRKEQTPRTVACTQGSHVAFVDHNRSTTKQVVNDQDVQTEILKTRQSLSKPQCNACYNHGLAHLKDLEKKRLQQEEAELARRVAWAAQRTQENNLASYRERQATVRRDLQSHMSRYEESIRTKAEKERHLKQKELESELEVNARLFDQKLEDVRRRHEVKTQYRQELDAQIASSQKRNPSSLSSSIPHNPAAANVYDHIREQKAYYLSDLLNQIAENRRSRDLAEKQRIMEEQQQIDHMHACQTQDHQQARFLEEERRRRHQTEMLDFLQLLEQRQRAAQSAKEKEQQQRLRRESEARDFQQQCIQRARERMEAEQTMRLQDLASASALATKQALKSSNESCAHPKPVATKTLYECPSCLRAVTATEISPITSQVRRIVI
eukprot:TRINITY_DN9651_c0_g1_i2.p1 TRINITY_DN9651_c0_g1~~TRINITY_DN9651_c0_g1_i2.p1  ORF type:complete len:452 (+),score=98.77 TRINITY_DN9651_c0_g1_i2:68-1423(+)